MKDEHWINCLCLSRKGRNLSGRRRQALTRYQHNCTFWHEMEFAAHGPSFIGTARLRAKFRK
jgi:hypothetical protein